MYTANWIVIMRESAGDMNTIKEFHNFFLSRTRSLKNHQRPRFIIWKCVRANEMLTHNVNRKIQRHTRIPLPMDISFQMYSLFSVILVNMNQMDLRHIKRIAKVKLIYQIKTEQRKNKQQQNRATVYGYVNSKHQNHWRNERSRKKQYRPLKINETASNEWKKSKKKK